MDRLFSHQNKEQTKKKLKKIEYATRILGLQILKIWRFSFALTISS